jgi:hypothetical protein
MATFLTFLKSRFNNAEQIKEKVAEANPTVTYLFIGNHLSYPNESVPQETIDSVSYEKSIWDNMIGAKLVTGNDIEHIVPRVNWTSLTKYRQYDDTTDYLTLLSSNTSLNVKPMYVMNSDRNVYLCLSNNTSNGVSANSTVEPTGDFASSNGVIDTADGYRWKYLYSIKPGNKFFTTEWIPAPRSKDQLDYTVSATGIVDGELTTIVVTNPGVNYRHASINVTPFVNETTQLSIANSTIVLQQFGIPTLANLANMSISGTGIRPGTFISSVDTITGIITLSTATNAAQVNISPISVTTRVAFSGDGTRTEALAYVTTSNTIANVKVTTVGINYSYANVTIYGSGVGATARTIMAPKMGHGYNSAKQLGACNLLAAVRMGEIDSTEGGLISSNTSFRQYGLLRNPHKYSLSYPVSSNSANSVISQTTDLTMIAGTAYQVNEFAYQGTIGNPTAYGYVVDQTETVISLTKVKGTILTGESLIGANSSVARTVVNIKNPEFKQYTGDILHVENVTAIDREDGQSEEIKFVLKF